MPSLGMPEIAAILVIAAFWMLPVAASVWALLTLHRIRVAQQAMGANLETIVRIMQTARQAG